MSAIEIKTELQQMIEQEKNIHIGSHLHDLTENTP